MSWDGGRAGREPWWGPDAEPPRGPATPEDAAVPSASSGIWWSDDPVPASPPAVPAAGSGAGAAAGSSASGWPPAGTPAPLAVPSGTRIGPYDDPARYVLHQPVSSGTEGEVWRGSLSVDGNPLPVAVKVIADDHLADLDRWSERWRRQAEVLRSLDHPHLVRVREVFEGARPGGAPNSRCLFLVMNWADGVTLNDWVMSQARSLSERVAMIDRIGEAVAYLHSGVHTNGQPVLHRDLKPANVIVDGLHPRLVDFGFVRFGGHDVTMVGTAGYIAPEVAAGRGSTPASDRFSFGALAFAVLTARKPEPEDLDDPMSAMCAIPALAASPAVCAVVASLLAADPDRRPATIPALLPLLNGGWSAAPGSAPGGSPGATPMHFVSAAVPIRPPVHGAVGPVGSGDPGGPGTVVIRVPEPPVSAGATPTSGQQRPRWVAIAIIVAAAVLGLSIGVTVSLLTGDPEPGTAPPRPAPVTVPVPAEVADA